MEKFELIPHVVHSCRGVNERLRSPVDGFAFHQVVGEVTAHQAYNG